MTNIRALCAELVETLEGRRFNYVGILDRARAALAEQPVGQSRRCIYNPVQIAECGGPCEQIGPEACDCGALWVDQDTEQPVGPTDEELDEFGVFWWGSDTDERTVTDVIECCSMAAFARAVLARWGTPNLAQVRSSLGEVVEDDVDLYLEQ